MTDLRQAAQQALRALEYTTSLTKFLLRNEKDIGPMLKANEAIHALRTTLEQQAEPVQEPICYASINKQGDVCSTLKQRDSWRTVPLYTAPPQQQAEPVAWVCYGNVSDEKHAVDYQQEDVDALSVGTMLYTTPPQRKPLPKGEWPKHKSPYVKDEYIGYAQSDLDDYAMQVLAAHGIKEGA